MMLMWRPPTKDRLVRFDIITDRNCSFCDEEESMEHLFFNCKITPTIWKEIDLVRYSHNTCRLERRKIMVNQINNEKRLEATNLENKCSKNHI